jgi:hypothetical protein
MSENNTQIALTSSKSSALARRTTESLAKRGINDLEAKESAQAWFQRAKNLYSSAPKDGPVDEFRASLKDFFSCIQRAASLDPQHPGIQYWLGTAFRDGLGTDVDSVAAAEWIQRAAEQGLAEAQFEFGGMLMYGEGASENAAEAVEMFRRAAEQNYVDAQVALGVAYGDGTGVTKDSAESVRWFRNAAEQNSANAQYFLAEALAEGRGITEDLAEAAKWYQRAASQGIADAQFRLGRLYYQGRGVPEDLEQAKLWFGKAAEQGLKEAKIMLDVCLAGIDHRIMQRIAAERRVSVNQQPKPNGG